MVRILKQVLVSFLFWVSASCASDDISNPNGYLLVSGWYKNLDVQQSYTQAMIELIHQHHYLGGVIGIPEVNLTVLEGNWAPRLLIMARFKQLKDVKHFWWSESYQQVKKIREAQSVLDVVATEGLASSKPGWSEQNAYLIFLAKVTDRQRFLNDYAPFAPRVVSEHGGQFVIRAARSNVESLEGNWLNASLVVVEFPTANELKHFWESPEYRELSDIRKNTGDWSVISITPR